MSYLQAIFVNIATRFWRWKFRIRNSYHMDRMSSILQWRLLKFNCCLLCFQAAVFCNLLFSKRHLVLRASSSDDLTGRGLSHIPTHIFIYILAFVSNPQTTPRSANMCGNIPSCFAPLDDRSDRTNHMKSASLVETPACLVYFSFTSSRESWALLFSRPMFWNRSRSTQHFR